MESAIKQFQALEEINDMEPFFQHFNMFDEEPRNINKVFPFEDYSSMEYYDKIFPNPFVNGPDSNKSDSSDEDDNMLDKLTYSIDNYNSILRNEFFSKFPSKIEENLKLAENTLPGNIIKLMIDEEGPIDIEKLYENLKDKMNNFRKANGSKYCVDAKTAILSTLKTSNIFYKNPSGLYYFKEKEAYEFIYKNYDRDMKKKILKSKKESKSSSKKSLNNSKIKQKKRNDNYICSNMALKIQKINLVLEQMIKKFRKDPRYQNLKNLINKKNQDSLEVLKEWCEKDKFIGMLMCLKYFKNLSKCY